MRAAKALGISIPQTIGTLVTLWLWCLDNAPNGDLDIPPDIIADACGWKGDPDQFIGILVKVGFLDAGSPLRVHDWQDYVGKLMERRESNRAKVARNRALYGDINLVRVIRQRDGDYCRYCGIEVDWKDRKGIGGGTYDHIEPKGPNAPTNIVVACRSCNSSKGGRTPVEAGMILLPPRILVDHLPESTRSSQKKSTTVPDQTRPYPTKPLSSGGSGSAGAREKPSEEDAESLRSCILAYETEIGMITKAISERITEEVFGGTEPAWIVRALQESAKHNKRSWAYADAILQRWKTQGHMDNGPPKSAKEVPRGTSVKHHKGPPADAPDNYYGEQLFIPKQGG